LVDLDEILYIGDAIVGDLDAIIFNPIALTILKRLPVVSYRCQTLSLTLRDEHKLNMFENSVLRRIFGLKWDEEENGGSCTVRSFIFCTHP
jgi:hypothetical protein